MAERTVKNYDTRKEEILKVAQELFYEHGFEKTPINAIILGAGIAKGTFYHYFKSKEDLLFSMVDNLVEKIIDSFSGIVENERLSAVEKLQTYFVLAANLKSKNKETIITYMKSLYCEDNLKLRHALNQKQTEKVVPIMAEIVKQGVEEGVFHSKYPELAMKGIWQIGFGMAESLAEFFQKDDINKDEVFNQAMEAYAEQYKFFESAINQLLGAEEETISLKPVLEEFSSAGEPKEA